MWTVSLVIQNIYTIHKSNYNLAENTTSTPLLLPLAPANHHTTTNQNITTKQNKHPTKKKTMIPFETTDSIIEILWDLALAVFVLRLGLVYLLLNALSTTTLLLLSHHDILPTPQLPQSTTLLYLALASALWTRLLVVRYEVPRVALFRLGIGAVAAGLGLGVVGVVGWKGMGWGEVVGLAGWVGAMPVVQMVGEGVGEKVPRMRGMEEKGEGEKGVEGMVRRV